MLRISLHSATPIERLTPHRFVSVALSGDCPCLRQFRSCVWHHRVARMAQRLALHPRRIDRAKSRSIASGCQHRRGILATKRRRVVALVGQRPSHGNTFRLRHRHRVHDHSLHVAPAPTRAQSVCSGSYSVHAAVPEWWNDLLHNPCLCTKIETGRDHRKRLAREIPNRLCSLSFTPPLCHTVDRPTCDRRL
jgi:hypothetical protein